MALCYGLSFHILCVVIEHLKVRTLTYLFVPENMVKHLLTLGRGGGLLVSVLAFHSHNLSSNPA